MLRRNKKEIWGCLCETNNKMFSGLGKERGRCWRGDISSLVKKQFIYNPTNISLPINLQIPQTLTFQFFIPHKHYTYQPSNLYPKPHKPKSNPTSVINKKFLI
jgi:hypothetical protein